MVQRFRLGAAIEGVQVQSLVKEPRFHTLFYTYTNIYIYIYIYSFLAKEMFPKQEVTNMLGEGV